MIVCHCYGVSEERVRESVRAGASSPEQVGRACFAGRGCGSCRERLVAVIESETAELLLASEPATPILAAG